MSSTNRGSTRQPDDFYATPAWAADALFNELDIDAFDGESCVLDPCAGEGAVLARAKHWRYDVRRLGFEINPGRTLACGTAIGGGRLVIRDALTPARWADEAGRRSDLIVTNPPYALAMEFVTRALAEVAPGGTVAMLLRLPWLASQKRAPFHREHPADIYVLPRRPSFTPDGKTDSADYAWFVWGPDRGGRWSILYTDGAA